MTPPTFRLPSYCGTAPTSPLQPSKPFTVGIGGGANYESALYIISDNKVITNVTRVDDSRALTLEFSTSGATVTPLLPDNTALPAISIPGLLGITLNSTSLNAINTVATYITAQIYASNNGGRRQLLRALLDNPGCDFFPDTACTIPCCAEHDQCYKNNGCTFLSWNRIIGGVTFGNDGSDACLGCNVRAAACVLATSFLSCKECALISQPGSTDEGDCYDNKCGKFFSCKGTCPCSLVKPNPSNRCCECKSPCKTSPPTTPKPKMPKPTTPKPTTPKPTMPKPTTPKPTTPKPTTPKPKTPTPKPRTCLGYDMPCGGRIDETSYGDAERECSLAARKGRTGTCCAWQDNFMGFDRYDRTSVPLACTIGGVCSIAFEGAVGSITCDRSGNIIFP